MSRSNKKTKPQIKQLDFVELFDSMTIITNSVNKTKLSSVDFASFLIDSRQISDIKSPAHYPPFCYYDESLLSITIEKENKKVKVIIDKELLNKNHVIEKRVGNEILIIPKNFNNVHKRIKEIAHSYIEFNKKKAASNKTHKNKINLVKTEEIGWEIFPIGDWFEKKETSVKIYEYFNKIQNQINWRNKTFDSSRLDGIYKQLNPCKFAKNKMKYEGYIVFFFGWTDKVILECPIYGNATYIISSGRYSWQEIAKNSKLEARTRYSEQVTVINHSETWLERLEQSLIYGL